ncbi:MAG: hypothetical protein J0G35_14300 [Acidobacteriales bacterium]|nr:hypothetical protein [Terriglobales bacterium]
MKNQGLSTAVKSTGIKDRGHQTQWAAQFAVASELCKRGYEVAFTSGHTTPVADLMVVSPIAKKMFLVDVKGLYRKNPWLINRKLQREDLYYVLAYVPQNEPNQFFIMTQQQTMQLIQDNLNKRSKADDYRVTGFAFNVASPYSVSPYGEWKTLPK